MKAATELPLASLFPCEVAVAQAVPAIVEDELYEEERAYVKGAVVQRRAEFGTARVLARRALAELDFAACPLVPYPDFSPRWPEGAIGSISHTKGLCAVAVSLRSRASGLGLDVERDAPLAQDLEPMVCTETERRWLDQWTGEPRGRMAMLFFSAKEAFYKCQYPTTGSSLDFLDVELRLDPDAGTFGVAHVHRDGAARRLAEQVRGRLLRAAGLVVSAATL